MCKMIVLSGFQGIVAKGNRGDMYHIMETMSKTCCISILKGITCIPHIS